MCIRDRVMLLRGFADAIMMRTQLAMATEGSPGYLPPEHYDQIFTAHGVIMIIFMAMVIITIGSWNGTASQLNLPNIVYSSAPAAECELMSIPSIWATSLSFFS